MRTLIREEFNRTGMWHHCLALIRHLGNIQVQLGQGVEYFQQRNPGICEYHIQQRKEQYGLLKNVLLQVDEGEI